MELPPCNQDVYKNGTQVFLTHTIRSAQLEEWVQTMVKESGQPVDWHWYGGRAVILALGDLDKVRAALKNNRHMHDNFYIEACKGLNIGNYHEESSLNGIWHYNGL